MKITIITEFFPSQKSLDIHGGIEARTFAFAQSLAQKHTVVIITSYEKGKPRKQVLNNIFVHRVGPQRVYGRNNAIFPRLLFTFHAFWKALLTKPDIIEGAGFFGYIPAYFASFINRSKRTILIADTVESYVTDVSPVIKFLLSFIERFIFFLTWDAYICISHTVAKKIFQEHKENKKIHIVYCGVDSNLVEKVKTKKTPQKTIICVNRLVSYKRVNDVIAAFSIIRKKIPDVKLRIVGIGEELKSLKIQARTLDVHSAVEFCGFIPDHQKVLSLIASSHVFCSASLVEGFGIAPVESLAVGTPVVLSDIPVHKEVTEKGGAVYFKQMDVEDCAKKILEILSNSKNYLKLQKMGYSHASHYTWDVMSAKTEKIYESLYSN